MSLHKRRVGPKTIKITFKLPSAIIVSERAVIIGSFTNWQTVDMYLVNGVWQVTFDLPEGEEHEYRYLIDGEPNNDWEPDCFRQLTGPVWSQEEYSVVRVSLDAQPAPA